MALTLKSALVATLLTAGLSTVPATAQASNPYGSYGHCVEVTYDHIGCWLIDTFGIIEIEVDVQDEDRLERVKSFEDRVRAKARPAQMRATQDLAGHYNRTCSDDELLDLVERTQDGAAIVKACFKPVETTKPAVTRETKRALGAARAVRKISK